jgi:hypothetical protein
MDWQPMETAPKDGSLVMLFQDGQINVAYWRTDSKVGPVWCTPDSHAMYKPTYWMPLPLPPSPALESALKAVENMGEEK